MLELKLNLNGCFLWTDLTIVLHMWKSSPHNCKTFFANTVSKIQNLTAGCIWNHVQSVNNLTDYLRLNTFVNKAALMRVGGRIQHSHYSYATKNAIVLPKNHHATNLIIKQHHLNNLHSGNPSHARGCKAKVLANRLKECSKVCYNRMFQLF